MIKTIVYNNIPKLDKGLIKKLKSLTLRDEGEMAKVLSDLVSESAKGKISVVYKDNQIVSWAMVSNSLYQLMCYTRACERRKGYGTRACKALKPTRGMRVCKEPCEKLNKDELSDEFWGLNPRSTVRAKFWKKVKTTCH